MNHTPLCIRPAQSHDFEAIHAIYAHYVLNTSITFEETVPSVDEMRQRWEKIKRLGASYYVALEGDTLIGYAYFGEYRSRSAFRFTVENSIYLAPNATSKGVGSQLLQRLIDDAQAGPWHRMVALITSPQPQEKSLALHQKFGFTLVGTHKEVGYKFDRWYDLIILEREV